MPVLAERLPAPPSAGAPPWIERYHAVLRHSAEDSHRYYPGDEHNPTPLELVDPIVDARPGLISKSTRIAAMGSCFAAEIKDWLVRQGYRFVQREGEKGDASSGGSAAYGRVFTTQSIRQHFEFAYGAWSPAEKFWRKGAVLSDPYRGSISWKSEAEMERERAEHSAAVREVIAEADVFILTIGLIESFRSRVDGAAFYRMPPRSEFDPERHEPHWYSVEENVANLERTYELMRAANPNLQLILTVSPVPLRASLHPMGAVIADEESKATLRIAAMRFCAAHPEVVYFPSFEIVRKLEKSPFMADNRHVEPHVVTRIMRTFMQNYGDMSRDERAEASQRDAAYLKRARRSLEYSFRVRYLRERVLRVVDGAGASGGRIAIFGAGRHTVFLLEKCGLSKEVLARLTVVDDSPQRAEIAGIRVLRAGACDAASFAAVIVSSDAMESTLAQRAREWAGTEAEVVLLYEGMEAGPYALGDGV